MNKHIVLLLAVLAVVLGALPLRAQTTIGTVLPGTITLYSTGWYADQVIVRTTAPPVLNGCSTGYGFDGYITNPSDPTNHAHQAALLGAMLAGRTVKLGLQGCYLGRPQILSVTICIPGPQGTC